MAIVDGDIPNLINGVSQQPDRLRLPSQCEAQVNCISSVVDGLSKRPPTLNVAKLLTSVVDDPFVHFYDRDLAERYCVMITDDDLKVFDVDGTEKTVAFPDGKGYLTSTDPRSEFKAITVADYTFIVNTGTTVAKTATKSAAQNPEAIVYIKSTNYGRRYTVNLNGTEVYCETGTAAADEIGTERIAKALTGEADLTGTGVSHSTNRLRASDFSGYTFTRYGSTIHITRATAFTITGEDDTGNTSMIIAKDEIQKFSDLPTRAKDGFIIKVRGDNTNQFDDYYVKFTESAGDGVGTWSETVQPDVNIELDPNTMPHQLIRETNGTFTFQEAAWTDRLKGGDTKNPFPSFVDTTIEDVFFWKNRLGFLADENAILSEDGEFFNFFRTTVLSLLDSDVVDTSNINTKVSLLKHAVPLNEKLVLFAENQQFILEPGAGNTITPTTATIDQTTAFHSSPIAKPIAIGDRIFFSADKEQATAVREYLTDTDSGLNKAFDVTDHVPKYIPKAVFDLAGTGNENILVAIPETNAGSIFVYQYYFSGADKLQSAWHNWVLGSGAEVLGSGFIEATLYLVVKYSDGVWLEKVETEESFVDTGLEFQVTLDRRIDDTDCTLVYAAGTNLTTITLPYTVTGTVHAVVQDGQTLDLGLIAGSATLSAQNSFTVKGDVTAVSMWIGLEYEASYTFSKFYNRVRQGNSTVTDSRNKIHLIETLLAYDDSGYFRVEVTTNDSGTYTYVMPGRIVGSAASPIGGLAISDGEFKFGVGARNDLATIRVINDTHLPMQLQSASWLGEVVPLSQRV